MMDLTQRRIFGSMSAGMEHYLYSLDASTDDFSVVVFSAEWTRMLALPQKVESATIACPLWTVTVEEKKVRQTVRGFKNDLRGVTLSAALNVTTISAKKNGCCLSTKQSLVDSRQVEGRAWFLFTAPWQHDAIFSGHCGIASHPDCSWPALLTRLSCVTGPGNIKSTRQVRHFKVLLILCYILISKRWSKLLFFNEYLLLNHLHGSTKWMNSCELTYL